MDDRSGADRRAEFVREIVGDPVAIVDALTHFIADQTRAAGFERLVVGLSGGLDSALATTLATRALGPASVKALLLPCGTMGETAVADATLVTEWLGVSSETIDIEPMVEAYYRQEAVADQIRRGNFMARQRMAVLFDVSKRDGALVLGTSNKSELLLGYGTLYGDLACAFNPLGDLYKTQVRAVARHLGVPERILDKPPTADLWPGQSDEGELGWSYEVVDQVLYLLIDRHLDAAGAASYGFEPSMVADVVRRIGANEFKRRPPVIAKGVALAAGSGVGGVREREH
jgi:NAD+ synthase